jgi:hypothetical protein
LEKKTPNKNVLHLVEGEDNILHLNSMSQKQTKNPCQLLYIVVSNHFILQTLYMLLKDADLATQDYQALNSITGLCRLLFVVGVAE